MSFQSKKIQINKIELEGETYFSKTSSQYNYTSLSFHIIILQI